MFLFYIFFNTSIHLSGLNFTLIHILQLIQLSSAWGELLVQLILIIDLGLLISLISKEENQLHDKNLYFLIRGQIFIKTCRWKKERDTSTNSNNILIKRIRFQQLQIDKFKQQVSKYLFLNGHKIRGPLARILGVISLFDIGELTESEKDFLLQEIKKSSIELDRELKVANQVLHEDLELLEKELH